MAMFVYLDESGDTGFRFSQNSSRYFVVTLLLVDDPIPLQTAIDDLHIRLGFPRGVEFKFSHSSEAVRFAFLRMLLHEEFSARALVVDKVRLSHHEMRTRESFYHSLVRLILTHDEGAITDATLILDESVKSRKSKKQFTSYLRRALNTDPDLPKVRTTRYHASHADNLIQAADIIAGAIHAKYHRNNDSYFNLIKSKVHSILEWDVSLSETQ